jgi:hypothetical protein
MPQASAIEQGYFVGATFLALDAMELLGFCAGGHTQKTDVWQRLQSGFEYLESIDPVPGSLGYDFQEVKALRHYTGHGAATSNAGTAMTSWLTARLLQLMAVALNLFWAADDEGSDQRHASFARAQIRPLVKERKREPVYVRDVLGLGRTPGDTFEHDSWRHVVALSTTSEGLSAIPES